MMNSGKRLTDQQILDFESTYSVLGVSKDRPQFFYHYTSLAGLEAILTDKQLRNSHILDMRNDVDEFTHGMTMFAKEVEKFVAKGFHPGVGKNVQEFFGKEMKDPAGAPCILCTTPEPNKEYHWKEYAGDGTGYCLKIDSSLFEAKNVIYDEITQAQLIHQIGQQFLKLLNALDLSIRQNNTDAVQAYFLVSYFQSLRFKKAKWADEAEWRAWTFVAREKLRTVRRPGTSDLRCEFISIDPLEKSIAEVIVGPKLDFVSEKAKLSAKFPNIQFVSAKTP